MFPEVLPDFRLILVLLAATIYLPVMVIEVHRLVQRNGIEKAPLFSDGAATSPQPSLNPMLSEPLQINLFGE